MAVRRDSCAEGDPRGCSTGPAWTSTPRNGADMSDDIDRTVLPIRRPPFAGVTGQTLGESTPDWGLIGHVPPPAGAPNVLLILIDDAGFGNPSTFGGPIRTPSYDRVA